MGRIRNKVGLQCSNLYAGDIKTQFLLSEMKEKKTDSFIHSLYILVCIHLDQINEVEQHLFISIHILSGSVPLWHLACDVMIFGTAFSDRFIIMFDTVPVALCCFESSHIKMFKCQTVLYLIKSNKAYEIFAAVFITPDHSRYLVFNLVLQFHYKVGGLGSFTGL